MPIFIEIKQTNTFFFCFTIHISFFLQVCILRWVKKTGKTKFDIISGIIRIWLFFPRPDPDPYLINSAQQHYKRNNIAGFLIQPKMKVHWLLWQESQLLVWFSNNFFCLFCQLLRSISTCTVNICTIYIKNRKSD